MEPAAPILCTFYHASSPIIVCNPLDCWQYKSILYKMASVNYSFSVKSEITNLCLQMQNEKKEA